MTEEILKVAGSVPRTNKKSSLAGQLANASSDVSAYEGDSTSTPIEGNSLSALQALALELITKTHAVARAGQALQDALDALEEVQEHKLPDLMEAHSLPKFEFYDKTTGQTTVIKLEDKWRVTMPPLRDKEGNFYPENEQRRRDICQWFRDIGKGAVVKKELKVPMGLVSDEFALEVMTAVKAKYPDLDPGLVEDIHQKTLEAQVRRMKNDGKEIHEAIVCQPIRKATVTPKK